jgi:hypothetical protein
MLALAVDGTTGSVLVIAHVGFRPVSNPSAAARQPSTRLVLTTVDSLATGPADPVVHPVIATAPSAPGDDAVGDGAAAAGAG